MARFSTIDSVWSEFGKETEQTRKSAVQRFSPQAQVAPPPAAAPIPPAAPAPPAATVPAPFITRLLSAAAPSPSHPTASYGLQDLKRHSDVVCVVLIVVLFAMLINLHCKLSKMNRMVEMMMPRSMHYF